MASTITPPDRRYLHARWLTVTALAIVLLVPARTPAQGTARYVNAADATCGGHAPCYATIQAAIDAALAGDTVVVQPGAYTEQVSVANKNNSASATEADRIVVTADPAAPPGSVVLHGTVSQCAGGLAVRIQRSKFVTLRGLTITGAGGAAVALLGGTNQNTAIHLERLRIVANGSADCDGGVTIGGGNPGTVIVSSLIHGNGRNGIVTTEPGGGPHYVVNNTIHGNTWNGISLAPDHEIHVVNNAITANGTAATPTGGRFGVRKEASKTPRPVITHLLNNLVCGNRLGEINGPALDTTDSGNLTPAGSEGAGVTASPNCRVMSAVYANLTGADGVANTLDDDFTLAAGSPALDAGIDPRTLGLDARFDALFTADYEAAGVRPRNATGSPAPAFDIGALEAVVTDTQAPVVTVVEPAANAYVRQTVTVRAQATDGTAVATFTLTVDGTPLSATLSPSLPPPASPVTAAASWNTTTVPDGAHTLGAAATDAAGNQASATRVVIVDNTPPETVIASGPGGEIAQTSATFAFSGSDDLTASGSLRFAWRLDGGAFSAFSAVTTAAFTGLAEGSHTFEVVAQDLAGNVDPTPAAQTFSVRLAPSITAVTPSSGGIGAFVTIAGTSFEPGTTSVSFNGLAAAIRTVTANAITTTVPIGATSGPLVVGTTHGTASVAFTVNRRDFGITAAPASVPVVAGTSVTVAIGTTASPGSTDTLALTTGPLPSGVTARFSPPVTTAGANSVLTLTTGASAPIGPSAIEVRATAPIDGVTVTRTATTTLDVQAPGQTVLIGQVTDRNTQPLGGVRILLGGPTLTPLGQSDAGGNFFIPLGFSGTRTLLLDGSPLNTADAFWPTVPLTVTITPNTINTLGFTPQLAAIPATKLVPIVSGQTTVLREPDIPGFEMTIPAGVQIIGWDGQPNTQVGVTSIPVDRSPLPPPPSGATFTRTYLFTFGKLGGGVPTGPVVIDTPNELGALPGDSIDLYYFNEAPDGSAPNRWEKYGTATVSADGQRVVTDVNPSTGQRYGMPRFCCGGKNDGKPPTPDAGGGQSGGACDTGKKVGEPVDAATGFFYLEKTDLALPSILPITITRTYRSNLTNPGPFGLGTSWEWDVFLVPPPNNSASALMLFTPGNRQDLFAKQADGTFVNTSSPALRGAVVTIDTAGKTLRLKDGRRWRFDTEGRLASQSDRLGNTVTLTRDAQRRVTAIAEPRGRQFFIAYEGASLRITSVRDPLNRAVRYAYDSSGRLSTVTDAAGGVTSYTYDASHRMLTLTDPRGITFLANTYDAAGRVATQTQADGGLWTFTYTATGTYVSGTVVTDPRGNATRYRFNAAGYLESETDALGRAITFTLEPGTNLLAAVTDALGRTVRYEHDQLGNVTRILDPENNETTFVYEPAFNRLTSVRAPLGRSTGYEYDAQGNMVAHVDPTGARTTVTYQADGNPASITDPLGNSMALAYDAAGNLATIRDPLGHTSQREYDTASRIVREVNPGGGMTLWTYDALDRATTVVDPRGGTTRLTYDGNGNVLSVTDARDVTVMTYRYDVMDRVIARTDALGRTKTFVYDSNGNVAQTTDARGRTASFSYDEVDRPARHSFADGSFSEFSYDAGGRITRAASEGGSIEQRYDTLNRLVYEATPGGSVTFEYDALHRRTRLAVAGGLEATYSYDLASRLLGITQAGAGPVAIEYDPRGLPTRLTFGPGVSTSYEYDATARLLGLSFRSPLGFLGDLTYTYDGNGNRISSGGSLAQTLLPPSIASAAYDAANQQLAFGAATLTYDATGNLVRSDEPDGPTTYTWDDKYRLLSIGTPSSATTFVYDVFGRRIRRDVDGSSTTFQYSLGDVIRENRGGAELSYLRGLGLDHTLGQDSGVTYLTDAVRNTVALVDSNGAIAQTFAYEPFGRTTTTGDAELARYQFTGRERESDDLYYFRARYYKPSLFRFIQPDPLGLAADVNLYAYAANNPLSFIDPLGLRTYVAHGISSSPQQFLRFRKILAEADPDVRLFGWSGQLFWNVIPNTDKATEDLVKTILAELAAEPLKPGEKLNLVGHSAGGIIAINATRALRARGVKVNDLIIMGTLYVQGFPNKPLPAGIRITNLVGRYDPLSWKLHASNVENIKVNTGENDVYTAHTSYTENSTVHDIVQSLIR